MHDKYVLYFLQLANNQILYFIHKVMKLLYKKKQKYTKTIGLFHYNIH